MRLLLLVIVLSSCRADKIVVQMQFKTGAYTTPSYQYFKNVGISTSLEAVVDSDTSILSKPPKPCKLNRSERTALKITAPIIIFQTLQLIKLL